MTSKSHSMIIPSEQIRCTVFIVILQNKKKPDKDLNKVLRLRLSKNWTLNGTICAYKCCRWVLVQCGLFSFLIYWHGEIKMLPHVSNSLCPPLLLNYEDPYTQAERKQWWTHTSRRLLALLFSLRPEKKTLNPFVSQTYCFKMQHIQNEIESLVTTMLQSWRFCSTSSISVILKLTIPLISTCQRLTFFFNMGKKN